LIFRGGGRAIREFLGEKIGEGATADIHVWAPGRVVKLYRAGAQRRLVSHEARTIRAVFAAGVPAPELFDEVTLEGRFGIVMQRLDGPTLLQLVHAAAMQREEAGAILATLHLSVHGTPPAPGTPSLKTWIESAARVPGSIPEHIAVGVLALIERLQPADGLCHGDLHPSNVIMTADGPRIIDWAIAMRAPAAVDLARCHVILSDCAYAPDDLDPKGPGAFNAALQSGYARLAGQSPEALMAAMEPYLPILRAFVLAEPAITPARRAWLIRSIEASLRDH
jgi:Ser/Thr protein kinase RdoA (MazF antagonist)